MGVALPDPLPLPDGWQAQDMVEDTAQYTAAGPAASVRVTVHQATSRAGRTLGAFDCVDQVVARLADTARARASAGDLADLGTGFPRTSYTVVEVVTVLHAGLVPTHHASRPDDLPPSADAFMRCLALVRDLARAYRVAAEVPFGLPSYERLSGPVMMWTAPGVFAEAQSGPVMPRPEPDDTTSTSASTTPSGSPGPAPDRSCEGAPPRGTGTVEQHGPWQGPSLMMLERLNQPDPVLGPLVEGALQDKFDHWMRNLRVGSPFVTWRDRVAEAARFLQVEGNYAQSLLTAAVGTEVLLDAVLMLLLWEDKVEPSRAAPLFQEGRLLQRITKELAPRLKGDWSTAHGSRPLGRWYAATYRTRNRVIHGGYDPGRLEAENALHSSAELATFTFDRIADRRGSYPRVTLMTVASAGLQKRGLYGGRIRRFNEQVAAAEPNWAVAFRDYRAAVVALL